MAAVHYQHAATTLVQPLGSLAAKKPCTSSQQYPHGLIPHLDRLLTESCLLFPNSTAELFIDHDFCHALPWKEGGRSGTVLISHCHKRPLRGLSRSDDVGLVVADRAWPQNGREFATDLFLPGIRWCTVSR